MLVDSEGVVHVTPELKERLLFSGPELAGVAAEK